MKQGVCQKKTLRKTGFRMISQAFSGTRRPGPVSEWTGVSLRIDPYPDRARWEKRSPPGPAHRLDGASP